jgi:rod shape determining protein RodA
MKDFFKYFDKLTFAVLLTLVVVGIFIIYSASHHQPSSYHIKQLFWFVVSLIVFFVVFATKTDFFFRISISAYVVLVVILLIQILAGRMIAGAKSWVRLEFIPVQIQFSEFIKIPLVLILAKTLSKINTIEWKVFFKLAGLIALPFLLIALQPDMGTAFILTSLMILAIFLKRIKILIVVFSLAILLAGSVLTWNYILKPYQKARIVTFLNPGKYKKSTGYQIIQSKIAIGSGGLKGKGYLKGSQSEYKFLPDQHTDFIFSVMGEEFGFLGVSFLFLLFFLLFYNQTYFKTESSAEFYFVFLFNGIIFFQFLINTLMSIGFLPVLGIPLPFISYGGSSLLSFFIGEALIFRIKINNFIT